MSTPPLRSHVQASSNIICSLFSSTVYLSFRTLPTAAFVVYFFAFVIYYIHAVHGNASDPKYASESFLENVRFCIFIHCRLFSTFRCINIHCYVYDYLCVLNSAIFEIIFVF